MPTCSVIFTAVGLLRISDARLAGCIPARRGAKVLPWWHGEDGNGVTMNGLIQDLRYAARQLSKSPGFALIALATLALGIGANSVIYSMVNGILLRPLGYREAQRLYIVREIVPQLSQTYPTLPANLASFRVWQRECHSFDDVAIVEPSTMTLANSAGAEQISGGRASANLLDVLGVRPILGRSFFPQEDNPGNDHVVILTFGFWRDRFHGDRNILGHPITLDGTSYEVVGVLPASFRFPRQFGPLSEYPPRLDYFKPLGLDAAQWSPFGDFDFAAIARLKHDVSATQALAELNIIQAQIAKSGNQGIDLSATLVPLEGQIVGPARMGLLLLLGGVGAVLLIVCLNVANFLFMRIPNRIREAGLRTALGASRRRLVQQMLTESVLLAVIGGALGVVLAYFGLHWLIALAPANLPRIDEVRLDARVLWFSLLVSALTGVLFGALPTWSIAQIDPQKALKTGATTTTETRQVRRLRSSLVTFEVAASTLLLVLAGLLTVSMVRLLGVDKGFTAEHVLAADISLPPQSYTKPEQKYHFYDNVLARVYSLPGVRDAAWISKLPLQGQEQVSDITVPGRPVPKVQVPLANYRYVTPEYFQAMGIPLLRGRLIDRFDRDPKVAVVSQSVADRIWPGEEPLGKEFRRGGDPRWPLTKVVGVVGDVRSVTLDQLPVLMVYEPIGPALPNWSLMRGSLVVRTTMAPIAIASEVREAIHNVDAGVPVVQLRPMTEVVSESVGVRRFQLALASLFAVLALLLAALGIYSVAGYSVARRRHELGIRVALGACGADLRRLVVLQGMSPVVVGWVAGIISALIGGGLMNSFLFGVSAHDPLTVACVTVIVLASALLATYMPARRAAKVDPMAALRYE